MPVQLLQQLILLTVTERAFAKIEMVKGEEFPLSGKVLKVIRPATCLSADRLVEGE